MSKLDDNFTNFNYQENYNVIEYLYYINDKNFKEISISNFNIFLNNLKKYINNINNYIIIENKLLININNINNENIYLLINKLLKLINNYITVNCGSSIEDCYKQEMFNNIGIIYKTLLIINDIFIMIDYYKDTYTYNNNNTKNIYIYIDVNYINLKVQLKHFIDSFKSILNFNLNKK